MPRLHTQCRYRKPGKARSIHGLVKGPLIKDIRLQNRPLNLQQRPLFRRFDLAVHGLDLNIVGSPRCYLRNQVCQNVVEHFLYRKTKAPY
ncbi:MAG: hypothetical protein K0Q73_8622 [Paenibacillus sp.]|nr:hypothetical protein [Paenibacillus sp.]